ncbi:Gfo/Idh/MocA family oxidoreductase [Spirosoma sp. RP8]|uniref:Gfo/Idh/MocA family oxidoreductase n=1 Tax=Spirosoma liriopis TaxID=2937440 RepID=A0ABT0HL09_9BACT|nr:Gfo/Idh/MocA family oxidoreductase [Spirosoma liriopis]MCK8492837.1 Gfo/Idh/MocA family oxidoreductase [Spirosoma liriopis]
MNQPDNSTPSSNSPTPNKGVTSRRQFIQAGALAATSFLIVPRHVLGGKGFIAPSDKLNIAGVGIGGKGFGDVNNSFNNGANNVSALCDVDWGLPRVKEIFGKFPNAKRYKDFREMLDKEGKNIDAVTVSTADHTHAVVAMAAMQRGKHVYVQKPMTHNIYEARMLTEAARKYKVVTQMGNQGSSNPQQKQMVEWFDKGLLGTVHTVHLWTNRPVWPQGIPVPQPASETPVDLDWDLWLGPAQKVGYTSAYHPFKWRGWWNFGAGALGDIGCHIMDVPFRVLGLGYPTEVETSVGAVFLKDWTPEYNPEGCPPSSRVELKFPSSSKNKSAVTMTWSDGGIRPFRPEMMPAGEPFPENGENGVFMIGDKGMIACGMYGDDPVFYSKNGQKQEAAPKPKSGPNGVALPENGHQVYWTEACKAGFGSKEHKALTSSFDFAGPLTESVLMGNLAIRSYMLRTQKSDGKGFNYPGRKQLTWDGKNMKITNFDEANQFVKREYRNGWSLNA